MSLAGGLILFIIIVFGTPRYRPENNIHETFPINSKICPHKWLPLVRGLRVSGGGERVVVVFGICVIFLEYISRYGQEKAALIPYFTVTHSPFVTLRSEPPKLISFASGNPCRVPPSSRRKALLSRSVWLHSLPLSAKPPASQMHSLTGGSHIKAFLREVAKRREGSE